MRVAVKAVLVAVVGVTTIPSATLAHNTAIGWAGYAAEASAEQETAANTVSNVGIASGASAAWTRNAAGDQYDWLTAEVGLRPATEPDGEGSSCSFYVDLPNGYYDRNTNYLDASVRADVYCNFDSPHISYIVEFQGYDPARPGGFVYSSNTHNCYNWSSCTNVRAYRRAYTCNGRFEHYGVPYGTYKTKDGREHTIAGDGVRGPAKRGQSMSRAYC